MIPRGYCQCGCGAKTALVRVNDKSKGWVKGEPLRYIDGHSMHNAAAIKSNAALGSKTLSSHGYVSVCLGEGRFQYEHILKAEKALGRALRHFGTGHPNNEVV